MLKDRVEYKNILFSVLVCHQRPIFKKIQVGTLHSALLQNQRIELKKEWQRQFITSLVDQLVHWV